MKEQTFISEEKLTGVRIAIRGDDVNETFYVYGNKADWVLSAIKRLFQDSDNGRRTRRTSQSPEPAGVAD